MFLHFHKFSMRLVENFVFEYISHGKITNQKILRSSQPIHGFYSTSEAVLVQGSSIALKMAWTSIVLPGRTF